MKSYQFDRSMTTVLNTKVWDCTLDGDVTGPNAASFRGQLKSIVNIWNSELNINISKTAKFDLSSVNALITSFKHARQSGKPFKINSNNNPSLHQLLSLTQFDKILLAK